MKSLEYYKYKKFNNNGEKCNLCDYVGEHYCAKRHLPHQHTEETLRNSSDCLTDYDILYKL